MEVRNKVNKTVINIRMQYIYIYIYYSVLPASGDAEGCQ